MKKILLIISLLPMVVMAQQISLSDTLWLNDEMHEVASEQATNYSVVQHFDSAWNGAVTQKKFYAIVHDERTGKKRNQLTSETFLYPDGATREELVLTYVKNNKGVEARTYVRKLFYPDGKLEYEETMDEHGKQKTTYYKPNGKKNTRPDERYAVYLTMPEYPGGKNALLNYLEENVKYPKIAQENGIQGRVIVQFVVGKDGEIGNVKVLRTGGDPSLDKEAVRVIRSMPRWIPGKERGKPVRVQYTVPVNFRLQ